MWRPGVLSALLFLALACQVCLWQLDKAFLSSHLPLGFSLPNSCQRSQKYHCGVVQSYQGLSKTICMVGIIFAGICVVVVVLDIWRPLEAGGCCTVETAVRIQAGGVGPALGQSS